MDKNNQPLVSIPVITYNSEKFVLETLESIKAQTYPNIELIISDDCSTDNTVELCEKWVEKNRDRFVRTLIIKSKVNTGVSANGNRGRAACNGQWIKSLAGDDLLISSCIEKCVDYIQKQTEVIFLFGKVEVFGSTQEENQQFSMDVFDYSFFALSSEAQLEKLVFENNCIPASTCFYNRSKAIELGIKNDERIPLLEDWPKWISVLEKDIKLYFLDDILVKYRLHKKSLSTTCSSINYYRSCCLFDMYYRYPRWVEKDYNEAVRRLAEKNVNVYKMLMSTQEQLLQIQSSYAYLIGSILLKPLKILVKIFSK